MKRTRFICLIAAVCLSLTAAADLTFFSLSDTHYTEGETNGRPIVGVINALPGTAYPASLGGTVDTPRALIMQGDLINDGAVAAKYPSQWANYIADFGVNGEGRCIFPVFEGIGNHDVNINLFVFNKIKDRNIIRTNLNYISSVSSNGYHYSWDWDGIHFVNVNLFPGNIWPGEADTYSQGHDPIYARDFLQEDLQKNGTNGRPVIVIYHFRPVDENWWTYIAADRSHKILQDYNVIMIMVGHQGGGVNNTWRGINWASSNGQLDVYRVTPDNTLSVLSRSDTAWGTPFQKSIFFSYDSSGLPAVINNGDWVSNVSTNSATLSGKILYEAVSNTQVTMFWGTSDGGSSAGSWQHSTNIGVKTPATPFSVSVSGLQPWVDYFYRCQAANSKGTAWAAASIPFTAKGSLPPEWDTKFIGYEQRPWGGAHLADNTYTVRGSGRNIGESGQPDNFQFAYLPVDGDGEIIARITSMTGNNRDPKAGIMLRETLADDSRNAAVLMSRVDGLRLYSRSSTGGATAKSSVNSFKTPPYWVKLVRNSNTFTGFISSDGSAWSQVGSPVTISMPLSMYAGLAVTAGNRDGSQNHTATFDSVSVLIVPEPLCGLTGIALAALFFRRRFCLA